MTAVRKPTSAYTVAMVAERWGTSGTFVYEQVKAGKLKAFKLGAKLIRITPEAVEEYEAQAVLAVEPEAVPEAPRPTPDQDARDIARLIRARTRLEHSTT